MRRRWIGIAIVIAVIAWWMHGIARERVHEPTGEGERADEVRRTSRFGRAHWREDEHEDDGAIETDADDAIAAVDLSRLARAPAAEPVRWTPSPVSDTPASIRIENTCDRSITLFWIDYRGAEREYTTLRPGRFVEQPTFEGHEWLVRASDGEIVARFASGDGDVVVPCADGTPARAHASLREEDPPPACPICSPRTTTPAAFTVESHCRVPVQLVWRDFRGATRDYGTIAPGAIVTQHSYVGHRWEVIDADGTTVARYVVAEDGEHVIACS